MDYSTDASSFSRPLRHYLGSLHTVGELHSPNKYVTSNTTQVTSRAGQSPLINVPHCYFCVGGHCPDVTGHHTWMSSRIANPTSTMDTVQEETPKKRTRKANWTPDETLHLVQLYADNSTILRSNFSQPGCTKAAKKELWNSIATQVTQFAGVERSAKECQKRYQTVQSEARARLADRKQHMNATGKFLSPFPTHHVVYIANEWLKITQFSQGK